MMAGLLDMAVARRVAATVAGRGREPEVAAAEARKAAAQARELVIEYTGLRPHEPVPEAELVDREQWTALNLEGMAPIVDRIGAGAQSGSPLPAPVGTAAAALAGPLLSAELGALTGLLAHRVLGQYDLALMGPERERRLVLVAPNLAEARVKLDAQPASLLRWICLHEVTHAVQFASVGWLRDHLGSLLEALVDSARPRPPRSGAELVRALVPDDPRRALAELSERGLVGLIADERQRELMDEVQRTMTVVEGHAEHVMDAIGSRLDPDSPRLRARLEQRRDEHGPVATLLLRLLGFELKLRQYRQGKRFCDQVVEREGIEALNRVWRDPRLLPDLDELEDPARWLHRTRGDRGV